MNEGTRRSYDMKPLVILGGLMTAITLLGVIVSLPDIKRYAKIRTM